MVFWMMLLLWNMNFIMDGKAQIYTCPYEEGLFYATSPDCLVYYLCENSLLWSGVCFPWQRFDVHKLACRQQTQVDCNPEYAGIWRQIYGSSGQDEDEGSGDELILESQEGEEKDFQVLQNPQVTGDMEAQKTQEQSAEGEEQPLVQEEVDDQNPGENNTLVQEEKSETLGEKETVIQEADAQDVQDMEANVVENPASEKEKVTVLDEKDGEEAALEKENKKVTNSDDNILGEENIAKEIEVPAEGETPPSLGEGSLDNSNTDQPDCVPENLSTSTKIVSDDNEVQDTTLAQSKQSTSETGYWYWCGSGRFVFAQNNEDGNNICLQLQDPEFVNREDSTQQGGDWAGHTFLGTDDST